jgi:hypothetical protein
MQLNLSNIHFGYAESPRDVLSGVECQMEYVIADLGCIRQEISGMSAPRSSSGRQQA